MVFQIISFLGLIIGMVLSKEFDYEIKNIIKFAKTINFIALIALIFILVFSARFDSLFFIGLFFGILTNYFLDNNYLYYGLTLMLADFMDNNNKISLALLIFIIGITHPILRRTNNKFLIISLILFALPFILLETNLPLNYNSVILGFSIGGIIIGFKEYCKKAKK